MKLKEVKVSQHYDFIGLGLKFFLALLFLLIMGVMVEFLELLFPFKAYMSQLGHYAEGFYTSFLIIFSSFLVADLIFSIHNTIKFLRYFFIVITATAATALFYNYTLHKNILTTPDFLICVGPIFVFLMLVYMTNSVISYYKKIEFSKIKQFKLDSQTPKNKPKQFSSRGESLDNKEELEEMKLSWLNKLADPNIPKIVAYNLFKHRFKAEYKIIIKPMILDKRFALEPEPMQVEDVYFEPGQIIVLCDKQQFAITELPPEILNYFESIESIEELKSIIWCEPQTILEEEMLKDQ